MYDTITAAEPERSVSVKEELFLYFGTCTRSLLTMFEITLGNWPPVARLLQDHVHEAFVAFSILHKARETARERAEVLRSPSATR